MELADFKGVTAEGGGTTGSGLQQEPAPQQAPAGEDGLKGCLPVPMTDVSAVDSQTKATTGRKYCVHCHAVML